MELPKIPKEQLTKHLREIVGDADVEFDPIVDPTDIVDLQVDPDSYYEGRLKAAKMLIESRKKLNEIKRNNPSSKENY